MSGRDRRSVGELLLHADLTSREILHDADATEAGALTRGWGEVVQAAAWLWDALPPSPGHPEPAMARIRIIAATLHRSQVRAGWPGPGDVDPRLTRIANDLGRAADLVTRLARVDQPLRPVAARDVDAAKTRLMHTVYLSTHGVALGLRDYVAEMTHRLATRRQIPPGDSLTQARRALERVHAVETLAGGYLDGRWPAVLTGEHRDPPTAGRLPVALAIWDLQAHRALVATPTIGTLLYVAHGQRDITVSAQLVMRAAAHRGSIDPAQYERRLQPAVADLETSWSHLSGVLYQLATPAQRRVDPGLLQAGNEVRAGIRDVTHDGSGPRSPQRMAQVADLAQTSRAFHAAVAASIDLAHLAREVVTDPDLAGAARGVQAVAAVRTAASHPVAAWVDAADLHQNKIVGLVDPVREVLTEGLDRAIDAAASADSAGSFLERVPASGTPGGGPIHAPGVSRSAEPTRSAATAEVDVYLER